MSDTIEAAVDEQEPHPADDDALLDDDGGGEGRNWAAIGGGIVLGILLILLLIASERTGQLDRLGSIAFWILVVVGGSAAVFAGSNLLISQASTNWGRYRTLVGALLGGAGFGLLRGNRSVGGLVADEKALLLGDGEPLDVTGDEELITLFEDGGLPEFVRHATGVLGFVEWIVVGLVLGGVAGWATGAFANRVPRLVIPAACGVIGGLLVAPQLQIANRPDANVLWIIVWAIIGAGVGYGIGTLTRHPIERALMGAAIGAVLGGWLIPDLGSGSTTQSIFATAIPLALVGVRFGWPEDRDPGQLADFNRRARAFVFLAPALGFVTINLFIPAVRTVYTSFLDRESEDYVGLDNYDALFSSNEFIDFSNWTNIFTSQLFWIGLILLVSGLLIGTFIHRTRNGVVGLERTGGSIGPILLGIFLLLFGAFSVIRGTFANTLWWMLTVTVASTVMGLTVAVLAERAGRLESTAKALVFMPMAISFVGAAIIWRFQYQPRNISKDQSGVLNALWIELGKLSHSGWPRLLVLLVLGALVAFTTAKIVERVRGGGTFAGFTAVLIVLVYLFVELARRSLGGFAFDADGAVIAETIAFREEVRPFNNVYLMFILIWIQTGFAMVILSAAIKAVPEEFLEASRIDGASESQQFFHVVLPSILPTIGVVVTTTLVAVAKVFDIVKVSTGGNFGTNVLANDFFTVAFQFFDRGKGSAIAVIILLTVAPVLILNVRQMQKEAV